MAALIAMALVLAIVLGTMVVYLVLSFLVGAAPVVCIIVTAVVLGAVVCKSTLACCTLTSRHV